MNRPAPAPEPTISVLVPVRNGGAVLDEAIRSIVDQTFPDLEILVVDDGSTDDTPARLREWGERDARVRVLCKDAAGLVSALEHGRAAARGRFLARMDADDVAELDRLEAQLTFLTERTDLDACGCLVRYFPDEAVRDGARRYQRWLNAQVTPEQIEAAMFVECPVAHPTLFARSDALAAVGGYQERGWPEDYDLMLRFREAGRRLGKVDRVLLHWREGPDRLSRTDARYAPAAFRACRVHYLRRGPLAGGRAVVVWGAGPVGKAFARALQAAGTPLEAWVDLDARKIGQEIHGAPVLDAAAGVARRGPLHLAAVGQPGARAHILATLGAAGLSPFSDFLAVA